MAKPLTEEEKLRNQWNRKAEEAFVGRKIVTARYPTEAEVVAESLPGQSIILTLDNGTSWMAFQDDEGNGPGAFVMIWASAKTPPTVLENSHMPVLGYADF